MRIKILTESQNNEIPRELTFDTKVKNQKDLIRFLKEAADFLESPIVEDKQLF